MILVHDDIRGAGDVMVIAVENRHGGPSLNPGQGCLHFT